MKLEITADKVKEAAAKCPQAEATLKTLFPEVFEDDKYVDLLLWAKDSKGWEFGDKSTTCPTIGIDEKIKNGKMYRFILSTSFNWELDGSYLIPNKK